MICFILTLIIVLYTSLIFSYAYFFKRLISTEYENKYDNFIKVSVIIPARNEAHCILTLLESIKNQNYPFKYFEIIVVDDASTDQTYQVVTEFANKNSEVNCKILRIEDEFLKPRYKKFAITKAIQLSTGELIITTDADCFVGHDWINGIVRLYIKTKAKMLVGLVNYYKDDDIFQRMQHLEFLSLIAASAAAVESGFPIMCNGANLIYERKAFDEVNGFDSNEDFASGDDVFLLLKMKKYFGKHSIFVLNDKNTIVFTQAKKNFAELIQQRIRWASKTKGYKDISILLVAFIVFIYNISIIFTFLIGLKYNDLLLLSLYLFIIKLVVDFHIMYSITSFINRKDLLIYYLPLQLVYLPYILIIGTISNFVSYKWKGRTIKK